MRLVRITSTIVMSSLLGVAASAYGQHDQQGEKQDRPQQQQDRHEQAKPEQRHAQQRPQSEQTSGQKQEQRQRAQQQQRPDHSQQQSVREEQQDQNRQKPSAQQHQRSDRGRPQQQQAQREQRPEQRHQQQRAEQGGSNQRPRRTQEQTRVQRSAWRQHGSQHWESDHRTWHQRGGYHGYRIPDDRFRGYFGSNHGFRIYGRPFLVVGGFPRFQYEGYWFSPVDPWPEYWGSNWYDNDEVYVVYVDDGYYMYNRRYPQVGIAINISM